MTSDLDIYRSANLLVEQHGDDAPIEAAMQADAMLEAGDLDGYAVWKRILWAVGELDGTPPEPAADIRHLHQRREPRMHIDLRFSVYAVRV